MKHWLLASAGGCLLGASLYACVWLRMWVGPWLRERFGNGFRIAYWIFTVLFMVVLANVGLDAMRMLLTDYEGSVQPIFIEAWFSVIALGVGLLLIFGRLRPRG